MVADPDFYQYCHRLGGKNTAAPFDIFKIAVGFCTPIKLLL